MTQTGGKHGLQELRVVLRSFYVQLLQLTVFLVLIEKLNQISTFSSDWFELDLIKANRAQWGEIAVFKIWE